MVNATKRSENKVGMTCLKGKSTKYKSTMLISCFYFNIRMFDYFSFIVQK